MTRDSIRTVITAILHKDLFMFSPPRKGLPPRRQGLHGILERGHCREVETAVSREKRRKTWKTRKETDEGRFINIY
jgi:hypothetical protein